MAENNVNNLHSNATQGWFVSLAELSAEDIKRIQRIEGVGNYTKWSNSFIRTDKGYFFNPYVQLDELDKIDRKQAVAFINQDHPECKLDCSDVFSDE